MATERTGNTKLKNTIDKVQLPKCQTLDRNPCLAWLAYIVNIRSKSKCIQPFDGVLVWHSSGMAFLLWHFSMAFLWHGNSI